MLVVGHTLHFACKAESTRNFFHLFYPLPGLIKTANKTSCGFLSNVFILPTLCSALNFTFDLSSQNSGIYSKIKSHSGGLFNLSI